MNSRRYMDPETGLIYLRARYYDPTTGQFLSRDPAVASTREAYGYTGGDPLNGSDPSGLALCLHVPFTNDGCRSYRRNLRAPDYVNIDVPIVLPVEFVGLDVSVTVTRGGNLYVGDGPAAGTPGIAPSVRGGWLNQGSVPCEDKIDKFVDGWGATASAQAGLSVGETYGFGGTATEVGGGIFPSAGGSLVHSGKLLRLPTWLRW